MALLKQSTAYTRVFLMVLSSDHVSAATGKTVTVNLSKAGAAFGAAGGAVAEIANGWYKVSLNTTDTGTLGDLAYDCTATGCDNTDFSDQVGAPDVNVASVGGTTQTARDLGASVLLSSGTGTGQLDFTSGVVKSNMAQVLGGACPAVSVTGVPKVDLQDIAGAAVSTSAAQLGVNAVQIGAAVPGSATIGTVTNLTNAASLSANDSPVVQSGTAQAGAASTITLSSGASATDNLYNGQTIKTVGGTGPGQARVITGYVGSTKVATVDRAWATNPDSTTTYAVLATDHAKTNSSLEVVSASVTADVGITQAGADKVWSTTTRAITDKVGFALSSAGIQAIWDALTSALTTVGSIGKLLVTNIDAAISSRSTYAGGDTSGTTTLLSRLTGTRATNLDNLDAAVSSRSTYAGGDTSGTTTLLARLTSTRAGNLDNLDATVSGQGNPTGSVATGTNSATVFKTNRTEATDDYWKDALIVLTSGVMTGQVKKITAYNGTTKEVTVSGGFTGTPADGVTFLLIDR